MTIRVFQCLTPMAIIETFRQKTSFTSFRHKKLIKVRSAKGLPQEIIMI